MANKLSIRVHEAKELPAGAVYIKDLLEGKLFTLKPYEDEPPESAIWSYTGFWDEYNSYWAHRWINVNHEREFKPNTIVYPL